MSQQVKISDELHARLKGAADSNYRSIGGEIEWMMDFIGGINGARDNDPRMWAPGKQQSDAKKVLSEQLPLPIKIEAPTLPRDKQILQEITAIQEIINAADPVNQDPDYWDVIEEHKKKVQELWSEWHEATGR